MSLSSDQLNRRVFLRSLGVSGLALAAFTAGCRSAVNSAPSAATSAASVSGSGAAVKGGTLTIAQGQDLAITSFMGQNNPNFSVCRTVFNTLTEYDHKTLQPRPALATSWQILDGGKGITFKLRDDVTFHTGRPFTADDVIFTVQYVQKPTTVSQVKHVAALMTDMSKNGDHEVTLRLQHPVSNLFDLFEMMIIPDRESIDALVKGDKIIGTGPFMVQSYSRGAGLKLKRYDKYWKKDRPYLDALNINIITESQSLLSSLRSGQSQLLLDIAPLDAAAITNDPNYQVVAADANDSAFYVASNVKIPPLDKKEVRQAVAWAIDRDRILKQALGNIGTTSSLPWSTSSPAFDTSKSKRYSLNPDKAKALLSQAGAQGAAVNVVFNATFAAISSIAEIVQFNLGQVGLKPQAMPLPQDDWFARLTGANMPGLFINGHGFGQLNPATLIKGSFPFNADKNSSNFEDPTYKDLANRVWTETDKTALAKAISDVNDFLLDQQFVSDLVVSSHTFTINKKLHGLAWNMYDYINLDDAYLA